MVWDGLLHSSLSFFLCHCFSIKHFIRARSFTLDKQEFLRGRCITKLEHDTGNKYHYWSCNMFILPTILWSTSEFSFGMFAQLMEWYQRCFVMYLWLVCCSPRVLFTWDQHFFFSLKLLRIDLNRRNPCHVHIGWWQRFIIRWANQF